MIDEFAKSKALLDRLLTVGGSLEIIVSGENITMDSDKSYLREHDIGGDQRKFGISYSTAEILEGIYQIDVCTPRNQGKWSNLNISNTVRSHFNRGLELLHDGQTVKILNSYVGGQRYENNHYINSISVDYIVIN